MPVVPKQKRLKKELGLLSVYAVATGATLSSGFFLLPGLAAQHAGPAVVLSYLLAVIPLVPATFSIVELATAMPRAGGAYYFLDRSMGPVVGTIGGMGTWLALTLKVAFALIGIGAYLGLFFPKLDIVPIAVGLALLFGALNLFGAKASGLLQILLVAALLGVLVWFMGGGVVHLEPSRFSGFFASGVEPIISTAGMVYISYIGVTKVASISEEVKNPERNLPRGVFLAVGTSIVVYALGTIVMVGVVPLGELSGSLTPASDAALRIAGRAGEIVVAVAALAAFFSVANAGILSASRYPFAMSRDHLLPRFAGGLSPKGIPRAGVLLTVGLIVLFVVAFDPTHIAELASAFQLIMFAMICGAVIIMRESRIVSYDPGYRSPFYPYMQIVGILVPLWLVPQMGWLPVLLTLVLVTVAVAWFFYFARRRVARQGAILHIFERLGRGRYEALDSELRSILREKGMREEDPFDEVVAAAEVIDAPGRTTYEAVTRRAARALARDIPEPEEWIAAQLMEGTRVGATPVANGVALPHFWHASLDIPRMVIVRAAAGIQVEPGDAAWGEHSPDQPIYALFYLVSPEANPTRHLRVLAQIANCVEEDGFLSSWLTASSDVEIKEMLLRQERVLSLCLRRDSAAGSWIDRAVSELRLPEGALIALIRRAGRTIVPRGHTVLLEDDRLTIIGEPKTIRALAAEYSPQKGGSEAEPSDCARGRSPAAGSR